jgi:hypothetical protein
MEPLPLVPALQNLKEGESIEVIKGKWLQSRLLV